jgi:hypothetical protein
MEDVPYTGGVKIITGVTGGPATKRRNVNHLLTQLPKALVPD